MRRLFADYPPDQLWALTNVQSKRMATTYDPIPSPERQMSVAEIQIHRRWIGGLALLLNYMLIPWTVWRGVQLVRKDQIEAIFTVPWDHFTVAAYFIHKITGVPIFMYIMDDPIGALRPDGAQPLLYRMLMPRLVRACKCVWGVSDGMCEYFEMTYGVKCRSLLPLVDLDVFRKATVAKANHLDRVLDIVYTGSIYGAQVDAVRRLVRVLGAESDRNDGARIKMQLTLYTSLPVEALDRLGLVGKNVRRDEVKHKDIASVIAEADVAFLPLSFEADMRHIVETSFPSKIAEYLAGGVPILVHAPSYSTVAKYCRKHSCGLVVDEPSEASLRDALIRLSTDTGLRNTLSAKALETARESHDADRIAPAFLEQMR
jgi:glycosyltransferase involved in cell wall biosynthesis